MNNITEKSIVAPHQNVNFKEGIIPTERQMRLYHNNGGAKYNKEYHCTKIVELMKNGASKANICKEFNISIATLNLWIKKYPDFGNAYDYAQSCAQSWWEDLAMKVLMGEIDSKAAPKLVMFMLEKRFRKDYGESKFYHITAEQKYTELSEDELDKKISQKLNELKIRDFTGKNIVDGEIQEVKEETKEDD